MKLIRLFVRLSGLFWSCSALADGICTPANVTPTHLAALRAEMTIAEVAGVMGCVGAPSSFPMPVMNGIAQTWTWGELYPTPWQITVGFRNGRALAASGMWGPGLPTVRFGAEFGNPEFITQ